MGVGVRKATKHAYIGVVGVMHSVRIIFLILLWNFCGFSARGSRKIKKDFKKERWIDEFFKYNYLIAYLEKNRIMLGFICTIYQQIWNSVESADFSTKKLFWTQYE